MGFLEILNAMVNLDVVFLVGVIMNNLSWVFFFLTAGYIFTDGKHAIRNGVIFSLLVLTSQDIFKLTGFGIYTAFGLGLLYMLRVPMLLFLQNTRDWGKHIPLAWVLSFWFVVAVVAFMT
ncbi:MAG: hypothetical protein HY544_05270 [Candidatus Diapherotrites archaeon]|uniref:Uncharacterized protein n=1 Tax=Candidatus Iainarchaeum sp. TaxID=3101447 RepID=A0A8T3YKX1_9ARCH|nr:hypothetical protein [Candidatus Diapherotrites archaeon]